MLKVLNRKTDRDKQAEEEAKKKAEEEAAKRQGEEVKGDGGPATEQPI